MPIWLGRTSTTVFFDVNMSHVSVGLLKGNLDAHFHEADQSKKHDHAVKCVHVYRCVVCTCEVATGEEEATLGVAFFLTSPTPTFSIVYRVYPAILQRVAYFFCTKKICRLKTPGRAATAPRRASHVRRRVVVFGGRRDPSWNRLLLDLALSLLIHHVHKRF